MLLFRLRLFKCKIEKASYSEKNSATVTLSTLKYLVCSLDTELKKLTSGSEELITPRKFSELKGLKSRFLKSWIMLEAILKV